MKYFIKTELEKTGSDIRDQIVEKVLESVDPTTLKGQKRVDFVIQLPESKRGDEAARNDSRMALMQVLRTNIYKANLENKFGVKTPTSTTLEYY
jgi:hypothetical protein